MTAREVITACILSSLLVAAAVYGQQTSRPDRLRIDTTLVLVPVEVSDRLNRPVNGLEKENFQLFDDQVEQKIVTFAMEDDPIAVCLVFDISGSMARDLGEMRHAAAQFFKTANPGDEFCLVEVSSLAQLAVPLTQDAADVDYKLVSFR
jgi:Ca-activated chloride channel family protein